MEAARSRRILPKLLPTPQCGPKVAQRALHPGFHPTQHIITTFSSMIPSPLCLHSPRSVLRPCIPSNSASWSTTASSSEHHMSFSLGQTWMMMLSLNDSPRTDVIHLMYLPARSLLHVASSPLYILLNNGFLAAASKSVLPAPPRSDSVPARLVTALQVRDPLVLSAKAPHQRHQAPI